MKNTNVSIHTPTKSKKPTRVGILFGGRSTEHEISLRSALFVLKNLPKKYSIIPIGISKEGTFYSLSGLFKSQDFNSYTIEDLASIVAGKVPKNSSTAQNLISMLCPVPHISLNNTQKFDKYFRNLNTELDCIFPVLHGTNGEDGRLQSLFELAEIPYIGCDRVSSVIGMDKDIQKRLVREAGIPTVKYIAVSQGEYNKDPNLIYKKIEDLLGFPCCIKPNSLGSTIGVSKVKKSEELDVAIKEAFQFDSKILAEEWINGTEVECGFLGSAEAPRVTTPGEISTTEFYSYEEKYSDKSTASLYVPARLDESRIPSLQAMAKKIAKTLDLRGFARLDFWNVESQNRFLFNEVNTIPGLTSISMFPKLWEYDGLSADIWLEELIENALQYK